MGSGSDKRQRNRRIIVRCTDSEFATILDRADRAGLFAAAFLRASALGSPGPRAVRRPPVDRQELARLLGELGRVGNNLNQIARALNVDDPPPTSEITAALKDFSTMRGLVHAALGKVTEPPDAD
jgi:hypothetical protein